MGLWQRCQHQLSPISMAEIFQYFLMFYIFRFGGHGYLNNLTGPSLKILALVTLAEQDWHLVSLFYLYHNRWGERAHKLHGQAIAGMYRNIWTHTTALSLKDSDTHIHIHSHFQIHIQESTCNHFSSACLFLPSLNLFRNLILMHNLYSWLKIKGHWINPNMNLEQVFCLWSFSLPKTD